MVVGVSFDYYGPGATPERPVTSGFAPEPGNPSRADWPSGTPRWPDAGPASPVAPSRGLPLPALLLGLGGVLLALSSLLPWVSVLVFDLSGLKVEWGAAALVGGLVALAAALEEATGALGRSLRPLLRIGALVGGLAGTGAALVVRQRIGSAGEGFDSGLDTATSDLGGLAENGVPGPGTGFGLEEGFADFGKQLAEAFTPSPGVGLWMALVAGLVVAAGAVTAMRD